jgi:hypothetical protein
VSVYYVPGTIQTSFCTLSLIPSKPPDTLGLCLSVLDFLSHNSYTAFTTFQPCGYFSILRSQTGKLTPIKAFSVVCQDTLSPVLPWLAPLHNSGLRPKVTLESFSSTCCLKSLSTPVPHPYHPVHCLTYDLVLFWSEYSYLMELPRVLVYLPVFLPLRHQIPCQH